MEFVRIVVVFLMCNAALYGQDSEFIRGRLLDSGTEEPIAFATIRIKNRAVGVISNLDGGFRIPNRLERVGDTLIISSMGYAKQEFLISSFSPADINIIHLKPGILSLSEAIVTAKKKRRLSARAIVRRAIRAIPKNYPYNPFSTVGYYRDYQMKKDEYINLNEAILEVFDQGFDTRDQSTTKVRIYEYRPNNDFRRDADADDRYNYENRKKVIEKAFLFNFGGNEFSILRVHDAIRNFEVDSYDFVNTLKSDFLPNHFFSKAEDTFYEDEFIYIIDLSKLLPEFEVYGRLYIAKNNFAIYKMEYALYKRLKRNIDNKGNLQNREGLIFEVVTAYKKKYNRLYLNYISFHNAFQLSRPPELIIDEITVDLAKRNFVVRFNKIVDTTYALQKRNYDFRFKGEKIRFEKLTAKKEYVELLPDMDEVALDKMLEEINTASRRKVEIRELLDLQVRNIRDLDGNLLNERKYEEYQQFREFFVQKVNTSPEQPVDTLYMKRNLPIFKGQPTIRPDNFQDYWMNTPLQNYKQKKRL